MDFGCISFEKLQDQLMKQGKKFQYLRDIGISPGIVQKLKENTGNIDTRTLVKICYYLHCDVSDIMEYKEPAKIDFSECPF